MTEETPLRKSPLDEQHRRMGARMVPFASCPILHRGQAVGRVTSGGFSPTLGVSIGMG